MVSMRGLARAVVVAAVLAAVGGVAFGSDWQLSLTSTGHNLYDIWGASPIDMFVVGQHGTFMRGSGSSWLGVANNPKANDQYAFYTTPWGTSASNPTYLAVLALDTGGLCR